MDELIKLVAQKCNIPEATARTAVETVVNQLKTRRPAPVASQLDAAVAGKQVNMQDVTKDLGSALSGLGKK